MQIYLFCIKTIKMKLFLFLCLLCDYDIFTIGHSNRFWDEFLPILVKYNISVLLDVRRFPYSRLWSHFNKDFLENELANNDIKYLHIEQLGGRRNQKEDGNFTNEEKEKLHNNYGWKNKSFRSFADYMYTHEFKEGIGKLLLITDEVRKSGGNVAIMCAEALPWRCHRRLISDYLSLIMDKKVCNIVDISHTIPHKATSFAYVDKGIIKYPRKDN